MTGHHTLAAGIYSLIRPPLERDSMVEFDLTTTAGVFLAIVVVATAGLIASGVMPTSIVLMMVLPSVLVFGVICLFLGTKYGEHRATH